MKKFTPSLIVFSLFICYSFLLSAQNIKPELNEINNNAEYKSGNIVITGGRDIQRVEMSRYDAFEERFIPTESVVLAVRNINNTRIDSIISKAPTGTVSHVGRLILRGDTFNRITEIEMQDNEGGSPTISTKKRITREFLDSTMFLTKETTETLGAGGLGVSLQSFRNYDEFRNLTSVVSNYYDPSSGFKTFAEGDSTSYEFNESNKVTGKTSYTLESTEVSWNAFESQSYEYLNEQLTSVTISDLNSDGTFKELKYLINQINGMDETCKEYEWEKAASYYRSIRQNNQWVPYEYVENIRNGERTTIIKRFLDDQYVNYSRVSYTNFKRDLYNLMKYYIDDKSYFRNRTESFGVENGWSDFFKTRVEQINDIRPIAAIVLKNGVSISETDSTLTLIKQTYDPGSGEWINNFKLEFIFTNISTGINKQEIADIVNVFPNPTTGLLNVQINSIKGISQIDFVNSLGQTLLTKEINENSGKNIYNIDLSRFDKGIYFVRAVSDRSVNSKKILLK